MMKPLTKEQADWLINKILPVYCPKCTINCNAEDDLIKIINQCAVDNDKNDEPYVYANGTVVALWSDGVFTKGKIVGNNGSEYYHVSPFIAGSRGHYSDKSWLVPAKNIWFFKENYQGAEG